MWWIWWRRRGRWPWRWWCWWRGGRDGFDVDDVVAAAAAVTFLVVTVGVSVAVFALLLSLFVAARRFWVWLCIIRAVVVGGGCWAVQLLLGSCHNAVTAP